MLSKLEVLMGDRQLFVNFKLSDLVLGVRVEISHVVIRCRTELSAIALWRHIHLLPGIEFLRSSPSLVLLFNGENLGSNAVECDKTDLVKDVEVVCVTFVENQF